MVREQTTAVRMADEDTISETVVFAVAAARDVCPIDLESPLYEAVDADALDRLLSSSDRGPTVETLCVEFSWAGCDVAVHGDGRVVATKTIGNSTGLGYSRSDIPS